MQNKLRILGLILICFWSCKNPKEKTDSIMEAKQIGTVHTKIAILINTEYNKRLEENHGFKSWKPTEKDVTVVQEILNKAIDENEFDFLKKPIRKNLEKYYRQYIPYVNENGERIIKINAFCKIPRIPPDPENWIYEWTEMDWKNTYVEVEDGGDCYWQITVNLDSQEYTNLMVNGIT